MAMGKRHERAGNQAGHFLHGPYGDARNHIGGAGLFWGFLLTASLVSPSKQVAVRVLGGWLPTTSLSEESPGDWICYYEVWFT